ncbi:cysteine desulfurase family protein [Paenibacillus sp. MBLB4367]|uniref:cysteine desulfurase family protein n=1 Tax=Paenibacillus sp. MBLB4367 TaxID=3384767 RepID=UPI0039082946
MLYFDMCATTPPHEEVITAVTDVMKRHYGNPSSIHRIGLEAEQLLRKAREVVSGSLKCRPDEIVFTSGGTESNNLAIKGAARSYRNRGKHIITSSVEHASVYDCCKQLEEEGYRITYLPVDETGAVRVEDVRSALSDDTILVSIMHVNNEVGRIQPVQQIGELIKAYPGILFHVDAIQSIGKLYVSPKELGADLLSVSAHKVHGPKGAGLLYVRKGVSLTPQLVGGGQESGLRSGTENVPLIVGMAKAVRMAVQDQQANADKLYGLRKRLEDKLAGMPDLIMNGSPAMNEMAPQLVHFSFPGMKSEVVVHALEQHGICISTRSACASGEELPSRVLLAMGCGKERAVSGLRVSFSAAHTAEDIDFFGECLKQVVEKLRILK